MEVLIVYHGKGSETAQFAEAIAYQLSKRVEDINVKNIDNVSPQDIINCDMLYLGTETNGLLFGQKPDKAWVDFVSKLPAIAGKQTVLFTTYKLRAGEMLHKMKAYLQPTGYKVIGSMKSSNGRFDYFSNGVLRYSLYQLLSSQAPAPQYSKEEAGVLEMA